MYVLYVTRLYNNFIIIYCYWLYVLNMHDCMTQYDCMYDFSVLPPNHINIHNVMMVQYTVRYSILKEIGHTSNYYYIILYKTSE